MPPTSNDSFEGLTRIDVDFNRLGLLGKDVLPLGTDEEVLRELGRLPTVGECFLAVQERDLDAVGTVRAEEIAGRHFWILDIEPNTLRQLE